MSERTDSQTDGLKKMKEPESAKDVIRYVYQALKAKGHDPIMQIVGYIISGDPTYITSFNNARSLIRRVERDEILEEFVRFYVEKHEKKK